MIVERRGQVDVVDFANRMYTWMRQGFQELGDTRTYVHTMAILNFNTFHFDWFVCVGGVGMGMTTRKTLTHPNFLTDPQACAKEVWEASRYMV